MIYIAMCTHALSFTIFYVCVRMNKKKLFPFYLLMKSVLINVITSMQFILKLQIYSQNVQNSCNFNAPK